MRSIAVLRMDRHSRRRISRRDAETPRRRSFISASLRLGVRFFPVLVAVGLSHAAVAADAPPAPTTPQADIAALLKHGLGVAEQALRKHGDLQPFGFAMRTNGEIVAVGPSAGGAAAPAQKVIEQLDQAFRAGAAAGEYKATAIFTDTRVTSKEGAKTDTLKVGLEHRSGYCVDVYVPYTRTAGAVRFAEQFTVDRDGAVFGACK